MLPPRPPSLHSRNGKRTCFEHVHEVQPQQCIPALRAGIDECGTKCSTWDVDQGVETSPPLIDGVEEGRETGRVADVPGMDDRLFSEVFHECIRRFRVDIDHRDMHPIRSEVPRHGPPEPTGATGHQGHTALQTRHVVQAMMSLQVRLSEGLDELKRRRRLTGLRRDNEPSDAHLLKALRRRRGADRHRQKAARMPGSV